MRHLSGLLPEGLKQEMYGLWEVNSSTNPTTALSVCRIMTETCVICRNMKLRAVQRPSWWNSLTSWRWSCRLTSTKSWRERRVDFRSSSTPPAVSLHSVSLFGFMKGKHFFKHLSFYVLLCSQAVSTTQTCSSSSALWMKREAVTWTKLMPQRTLGTLRPLVAHLHGHIRLHTHPDCYTNNTHSSLVDGQR